MFLGPDHSIRESLLMIATLIGFFTHMKGKSSNPTFIAFYFIVMLCIPALLISFKTW
jgi:hypothetical protein